jgi:hypothetical protein
VTSTGNTGVSKELYSGIANVTVWRVIRKRLHLKVRGFFRLRNVTIVGFYYLFFT